MKSPDASWKGCCLFLSTLFVNDLAELNSLHNICLRTWTDIYFYNKKFSHTFTWGKWRKKNLFFFFLHSNLIRLSITRLGPGSHPFAAELSKPPTIGIEILGWLESRPKRENKLSWLLGKRFLCEG